MTHFQGGDGEDMQLPGQPVGHSYRRFEVLGTGAMGTVYRGEDRRGNDLAVKLLRAELASDPVVLARFIQERALLLRLASPNIVRVVDLVVEGDTVAIVMERVDGGSLSQYLKRRGHRLGTEEAIQICIDLLEGLSVAHAQGVVHRDIKPDNVLIDDTSSELRAKVTDFGIAGLIEGSAQYATDQPRRDTGVHGARARRVAAGNVCCRRLLGRNRPLRARRRKDSLWRWQRARHSEAACRTEPAATRWGRR